VGRLKEQYKTALVTGASSGLGLAFTRHLLGEGIAVIGLSRSPAIDDAPEHYYPVSLDLSDVGKLHEVLVELFQKYPDIDLVVNNAGFGVLEHLQSQAAAEIEAQYAVMLGAPTALAARALAHFEERDIRGCLVNVSSLAVELPLPLMPVYNACKGGVSALSQSLILDASGSKKTYTVIDFRPGDFNTNFAQRMAGRVDWNGVDLRAVMERHHAEAPGVAMAVRAFDRAVSRAVSGTVRTGTFFQARIAPLGSRLFSHRWIQAIIRRYYRT